MQRLNFLAASKLATRVVGVAMEVRAFYIIFTKSVLDETALEAHPTLSTQPPGQEHVRFLDSLLHANDELLFTQLHCRYSQCTPEFCWHADMIDVGQRKQTKYIVGQIILEVITLFYKDVKYLHLEFDHT